MSSPIKKTGPVSFAAKVKSSRKRKTDDADSARVEAVEPLWTSRELARYLGTTGKNGLTEFLKRTPDFPAFKIGSEWRADPAAVRGWVQRRTLKATTAASTAKEETAADSDLGNGDKFSS